ATESAPLIGLERESFYFPGNCVVKWKTNFKTSGRIRPLVLLTSKLKERIFLEWIIRYAYGMRQVQRASCTSGMHNQHCLTTSLPGTLTGRWSCGSKTRTWPATSTTGNNPR